MKTASALVHLTNPAAVVEALTAHLAEHEVEVRFDGAAAQALLPSGQATLRVDPDAIALEARAANQAQLEDVTGFLASHVLEFAHPERPTISWTGFQGREVFADFREMRVVGVSDLTPRMRRVTLAGDDLLRFAGEDNLHVRLYFPPEGREPEWPTRGADGLALPGDPERKPHVRKYTIRRIDAARGLVEVDFVLHEAAGPGSDWAKTARTGTVIGMAGPGGRSAKLVDWLLLAGDETALPAIARILEKLPDGSEGVALIEVEDESDRVSLAAPQGVEIRWLHRDGGASVLFDAVRQTTIATGRSRFCWAGAEFDTIQAIRKHWRQDCGLDKSEQLAVAYWRHGIVDV